MSALMPPPLPPWDGIHPVIVHFPIALLLVSPLFVLLGLLPKVGRGFSHAALLLLVLGTIGAFLAVESGEAGAQLVAQTPEIAPVLQQHQELAGVARTCFAVMTVLFAVVTLAVPMVASRLKRKLPAAVPVVLNLLVFLGLAASSLVLGNVGHLGGRLVHGLGVQAWIGD